MNKTEKKPNAFSMAVIKNIKAIPRGKVATYGQIAALAGKPHGARGVSWILHSSSRVNALPWQRVLNSKGEISFPKGSAENLRQTKLLRAEGIIFRDGKIDLKNFGWSKKPKAAKSDGRMVPRIFS